MLDNLTLSDRLLVAVNWVKDSARGELPPINEYPRAFITLLEECRTAAIALEPVEPPPAADMPTNEHRYPVSDVYVPDEPSRGFLRDMGKPTKGHKIVDLARFRRALRFGGAR